jgi:outer membrane protein assembly factor BamE (lipoprotein component of BamABCDE complex)
MPREYKFITAAIALTLVVGACAPTLATRGNFLDDDRLKSLQQGVSTKDEVARKLGTPTTVDPFDGNTWFYIGEKTSTTAFFKPKVDDRKIIKLTFTEDGFLSNAEQMDKAAGKDIIIVEKVTPTPGRDMNAFQQFLSNIGRFNQSGAMGQAGTQGRQ